MRNEFRALAELRGRLLWRRFTARGGIAEGVASVVLLVIAVPVGLAGVVLALWLAREERRREPSGATRRAA